MENYNDLFNLDADDFKEKKTQGGQAEVFKPLPDKGKEGVYSAVVRFVSWHKDPKKSITKKWTTWLVDPLTDEGKYVDCPSSIGKKSVLQEIFFKYYKSDSAADKKIAKAFSRRPTYASVVQIIKDDNNPDTVGKLMIWPYGTKIHNKIQEQIQPDFGEPHIPFDIFTGKAFHVKVQSIGGYNNYDSCKFLDTRQPLLIDGKPVEKITEHDSPEERKRKMQTIIKYLEDNSPDLSKYDYKEWDEDTHKFVQTVINNTISDGKVIDKIFKKTDTPILEDEMKSGRAKVVEDPFQSTPSNSKKTTKTPVEKEHSSEKDFDLSSGTSKSNENTLDNYDNLPELSDIENDMNDSSFDEELYKDL